MATLTATGHKLILEKRRFDDYASMKQYFKNSRTKEVLFAGTQLLTTSYATIDGSDHTIATQLTSEAVVYISTIADDGTQDLKDLFVVYQDDTGLIHGPITHLMNDDANTSIEANLGNEDQNDAIATGQGGKTIALTALGGTLNQYAGDYMVTQSGDGVGDVNLIVSNDAATPTTLIVTDNTNAAANADVIQIQEFPCDDFYRVREMYCEIEVLDAKTIRLGDHDSSNVYGGIGEGHRYMANSGIFTQPSATCDTYLGRIKTSAAIDTTVTEAKGCQIKVLYTPFQAHALGGAVETELEIPFYNNFCWEPCIKLAPATDVVIQVKYIAGAIVDEIFLEASYLEVYK